MAETFEPGVYKTPVINHCLNCGKHINLAGPADGKDTGPPDDGSLCICIQCGGVMAYDAQGRIRGLTEAEMDNICNDPAAMAHLGQMVQAVRLIPKMN